MEKYQVNVSTAVMFPVLLILIAELLLFTQQPTYAVWLHVLVLIGLAMATIYLHETDIYMSYQALMLLPLLRLVNISMPIFFEMTLYSYIFIYAPLFIPAYVLIVHQKFTSARLGFTFRNLTLYIFLSLIHI